MISCPKCWEKPGVCQCRDPSDPPRAGDIKTIHVVIKDTHPGTWDNVRRRFMFWKRTDAVKAHPKANTTPGSGRFYRQKIITMRVMFDGKNWRELGPIVKPK